MTISVENSFLSEKALDYAQLSRLAYAEWKWKYEEFNDVLKWQWLPDPEYKKMWKKMVGKGYNFSYYTNDPATGFSATIFQKDGKDILAIRGSEDYYDYLADSAILDYKVLPYAQFQSLVDYIASSGLIEFDVTGHSLGGLLAQVAKATFTGRVNDVYTYNALGAKNLQQFVYKGLDEQGNVKLEYPPVQGQTWPAFSFKWPPSVYAAYQTFFANQKSSSIESHVYNVTGKVGIEFAADIGTDIGPEIFIANSKHGIQFVIEDLKKGQYYLDPRKPVSFIGSKADELIYANHDSLAYSGDPIQNLVLVGGYGNDNIFGSDGNDEIYGDLAPGVPTEITGNAGGRTGNNQISGGKGNDTLHGGQGDDTYYISYGDGTDRIIDTEGKNRIIYRRFHSQAQIMGNFYSTGSGTNAWVSADGKIHLTQNSPLTLTFEDGSSVTLSGDSEPDDFGINLHTIPEDTAIGTSIFGDLAPVDFDPEAPGIQTRTDEWGNVITTANPEADRQDTLYDTPASDKIEGKGNDDYILVGRGGNDWITGGAGNDEIRVNNTAPGNLIIEGNAGADHMTSGAGNDRIFCEDKGEMADLVEAGETADGLDVWGDHANGRGGSDYIYGSAAKDLLVGGLGSDLVAGGGGDDALFGDGDVTFLLPASWSIAVDGDVFAITMEHGSEMNDEVGDGDALYGGAGNDFTGDGFSLTGTSYN